jgi:hypothetical protein
MNQAQQQQAHPAAVAQEFMKRSDMKGGEVEAYAQTFNWLAQILEGAHVVIPKEAYDSMMEELTELQEFRSKHDEEYKEEDDVPVLEPTVPAVELDDVDSEASE